MFENIPQKANEKLPMGYVSLEHLVCVGRGGTL